MTTDVHQSSYSLPDAKREMRTALNIFEGRFDASYVLDSLMRMIFVLQQVVRFVFEGAPEERFSTLPGLLTSTRLA